MSVTTSPSLNVTRTVSNRFLLEGVRVILSLVRRTNRETFAVLTSLNIPLVVLVSCAMVVEILENGLKQTLREKGVGSPMDILDVIASRAIQSEVKNAYDARLAYRNLPTSDRKKKIRGIHR